MPSPDTSAQDAPVASQEAEARGAVLKAYDDSGESLTFETDEVCDAAFITALDAYAAAIRASERERYAELVEVASEIRPLQATGPDWWRCALCGHKERQLTRDPAAMHDANCAWLALRAALAALEESGSA